MNATVSVLLGATPGPVGSSTASSSEYDASSTLVIGFCALVVFVLAGVVGSVFLCISLKRDSFLWDNSSSAAAVEAAEHVETNPNSCKDVPSVAI